MSQKSIDTVLSYVNFNRKPFKGKLEKWTAYSFDKEFNRENIPEETMGQVIEGSLNGERRIRTSPVMFLIWGPNKRHFIQTLHSVYELGDPA